MGRRKKREAAVLVCILAALMMLAGRYHGKAADLLPVEEAGLIDGLPVGADVQTKGTGDAASGAAAELTGKLYAKAAVLLDMDSGRVLYEKNGSEVLPMASTTKIMTCILALEEGDRSSMVTASAYAAGQPKVHLGMQKGMTYQMDDLLYSLMLESHNDSAVAIAEYLGGLGTDLPEPAERSREQSQMAVRAFCDRMTQKAREIGCEHTTFLTPNGLDAAERGPGGEEIIHSTTAEDLALIMRYCATLSPAKEAFLEITRTPSRSFADGDGKRRYTCINHNAFLTMMDGALTGKTGFTNGAGYCYVGALERDGRQFALALLACGWPNHKTWKWSDSRLLFTYGLEHYEYREFMPKVETAPIVVAEGAAGSGNPYEPVSVTVARAENLLPIRLLTAPSEQVTAEVELKKTLEAPVEKGTEVGRISYYLISGDGSRQLLETEVLTAGEDVKRKDFRYIFAFIGKRFLTIADQESSPVS